MPCVPSTSFRSHKNKGRVVTQKFQVLRGSATASFWDSALVCSAREEPLEADTCIREHFGTVGDLGMPGGSAVVLPRCIRYVVNTKALHPALVWH